jgi:hypothetical protein
MEPHRYGLVVDADNVSVHLHLAHGVPIMVTIGNPDKQVLTDVRTCHRWIHVPLLRLSGTYSARQRAL